MPEKKEKSKKKKLSQYQKDRIKELILFITMGIIGVFEIVIVGLSGTTKDDKILLVLFLSFVGLLLLPIIILTYVLPTIKTQRKRKKLIYQCLLDKELEDSFAESYGNVKKSKFRENDYYVTFIEKAGSFKTLTVIAHIEVNNSYTQKDYMQFIESISEIDKENDKRYIYNLMVIFTEKEKSKFVKKAMNSYNRNVRRFLTFYTYDKEAKTLWQYKTYITDKKTTKKYLNKIFSFTNKK